MGDGGGQRVNDERYANWFSGVGATLLQLAAFVRPEFAVHLVEAGARLDLHSACALGETDSIRAILDRTPDAINHRVDTFFPCQFAARQAGSLQALLKAGEDPNRRLRKLGWFDWQDRAAERELSDYRLIHMVSLRARLRPHRVRRLVAERGGRSDLARATIRRDRFAFVCRL